MSSISAERNVRLAVLPALVGLLVLVPLACGDDIASDSEVDAGAPNDSGGLPDTLAHVDAAADADADVDAAPPTTAALAAAFGAEGFVVGLGKAIRFGIPDCAALPNCFGANPSSPYLLFSTPLGPGQTVFPGGIVAAVPNVPAMQTVGLQMAVDEAIVITGTAPPDAKYFSIDPYLFSRSGVSVFSALSDPTNQLLMKAPVFGQQLTFVVASDAVVQAKVRTTLIAQGVSADRIYPLVVPQSVAHLPATTGATSAATDVLLLLGRVALFDDTTQGAAYLADIPLSVLRLTPDTAGMATSPLAAPAPRVAGTGTNESAYAASYDALAASVMSAFPDKNVVEVTMQTPAQHDIVEAPANCIDNLMKCNGGDRDTTYTIGPVSADGGRGYVFTDTELVAVIGVNHKATGKSTYANIIPGNGTRNGGILSIDDPAMVGSATPFLPSDPNRDKLFVWFFARDCQGRAYCTNLPTTFPGLGAGDNFYVAFRAYLETATAIEPSPSEILSERMFRILPP